MAREKEILITQFKDLVKAMDPMEIEIAKKHIIAYDSTTTGESQKMFQIFSEVLKDNDLKYETAKANVSPSITETSFNRQLRRTLYRVQESLIVDVNLKRKGLYNGIFRKRYEIRKKLMQASILLGKGLPSMAHRLFDNIIKASKSFELYDELIEALMLKQTIILMKNEKKKFKVLKEEIAFYNRCRDLNQETKNFYQTYIAEQFQLGNKKNKIDFLIKHIKITQEYFFETNSANIKSQDLLLRMEYYYLLNDFNSEEKAGIELLELMAKSRAVYSKARIIYVCNSLANSMIANMRFKDSYDYIQKAIENSDIRNNLNYLIGLQIQITSLFYSEKYLEARLLTDEMYTIEVLRKYPFHKAFSIFQTALNHFAEKEYKDAYVLLSNLKEIEKDKEGWNVWIRIMRILCSIEMLRLNLIDYDVENFRRYIQRIDKLYEVRKRDKIILRVLRDLDKYDYDFQVVADKSAALIKQLHSTVDELKWDPKSPEMILFHDWFDAKLEKRPYQPNFEPYRAKLKEKQFNSEPLDDLLTIDKFN